MQTLRTLAVLALIPLASLHAADRSPSKPNILHIHADDHRADGLGAFGHPVVKTPNLDTLVARGVTFTHCYTMGSMVGAVCQPSRTMLLTGKSWQHIPQPNAGNPEDSLPKVISRAGYETWHCGKGGNEYSVGLKAFDTNICMDDHPPDVRRGSSERHADAALKFLQERKTDKPFYIYLAPPVPHDPRVAAPEFHNLYQAKDVPLPAAFMPLHPFDNGEMTVRDEKLAPFPRTPEDTKQQLADYYACITGLDHHVGRIFEQLKKSGQWENTIIVFTGDNGLSIGEHGLFGKQNLYEFGGMHVPCVIAGPGIRHATSDALVYLMDLFPTFAELGSAGPLRGGKGSTWEGGMREPTLAWWPGKIAPATSCDAIAGTIDLLPTAVALAGGKLPAQPVIDGRDISPLLLGQTTTSPRGVQCYFSGYQLQAIRKGPWKLAFAKQNETMGKPALADADNNEPRLYNLDQQIGEQTNLAAANPDAVKELLALAEVIQAEIGGDKPSARRPAGKVENPVTLYPTVPREKKTK